MLFTQLLLNAGSLKVEYQHTLMSYSHSNNLREIPHTHTEQSMGGNKPEFQSLSLQVWGTAQWARELSESCKEGSPEPGGQQGGRSLQSSRAEPPVAGAEGDQHGIEQHSGVWSSSVSAVAWNLPQLYLESGVLHPSGSFDKCLCTPAGKSGICPGACGWYMAVLLGTPDGKCGISPGACLWVVLLCIWMFLSHEDILGVSPCQMCLL